MSEIGINILAQSMIGLRELDVGWCRSINVATGCVVNLALNASHLEKISLSALRQVSDTELLAMSQLKNLTKLDVMGSRFVTMTGVSNLLSKCTNLQLLDLSYCEALTESLDMISQLKANYPNCCIVYSHCFNE